MKKSSVNALRLETPIEALGRRSLELESIIYEPGSIVVRVLEESTEKCWQVCFSNIQGLKVTTFESAFEVLKELDGDGALFEFKQSKWLDSLGVNELEYMKKARHFVICCYDEVVEVMAWEVAFVED